MVMVAPATEVVVMGAVGVLGWAAEAKSCFLTEEGVGWGCAGAAWLLLLPGDTATGAAVAREAAAQVLELAEVVLVADCSARADDEVAWRATDEGLVPVPVPCFGELLLLPGLTGLTGKGPQVLAAAGEKVPPNCAMGSRGWRICCMVWAARSASWGWA